MARHALIWPLLTAAMIVWAGCGEPTRDEKDSPVKRFPLRGEVTLLIPSMQRIVVRHDAVESWSAASNMEYPVGDLNEMRTLSVGDQIRAVVFVQGPKYWLGEIEVIAAKGGAQQ